MKVILIQGLLAPYRYPIFEELSKTPHWEFEVWFMGRKVRNRIWSEKSITEYYFRHRFLQGITLHFGLTDIYPIWINTSIYSALAQARPDVVIMMGWDSLTSFIAHLYCLITGTKFVMYADSTAYERSLQRWITFPVVKWHVRKSQALIAGGTRSKHYLESLGAPAKNIYVSFNTVDVRKYQTLTKRFQKKADQTRKILGLGEKKVILYYGQLIERKGVDLLLLAYQRLKQNNPQLALLLVGDGPQRKKLDQLVAKLSLTDVVILPNPGDVEICRYYAIASVFVLPSREDVWGLAVNEAMAAGLPAVVSDHAGCSVDLVQDGKQGYIFRSGDITDLAEKVSAIVKNDSLRKKMSVQALKHIKNLTPRITIQQFRAAVGAQQNIESTKVSFSHKVRPGLVSVIVPVAPKDEKSLVSTIASLQRQHNAPHFELIIEHDRRKVGAYQTRNTAIQRAHGEYIAFIDAGTVATLDWLRKGFENLRDADYCGGPIERIPATNGKVSLLARAFGQHREFAVEEFFLDWHFFPTTNLFVKRSVIERLGGFDSRLYSAGDLEFGDRVYRSGLFVQHFDPDLKVRHPHRTYQQLREKQRRLAKGLVDLQLYYPQRFGRLRVRWLTELAKLLLPPFWLLGKRSYQSLSFIEQRRVFLASYHLSFIHHWTTIRHGLLHER